MSVDVHTAANFQVVEVTVWCAFIAAQKPERPDRAVGCAPERQDQGSLSGQGRGDAPILSRRSGNSAGLPRVCGVRRGQRPLRWQPI